MTPGLAEPSRGELRVTPALSSEEPKVGIKTIKMYCQRMQEENITRALIVVQQGMTPSAKQVCGDRTVSHSAAGKVFFVCSLVLLWVNKSPELTSREKLLLEPVVTLVQAHFLAPRCVYPEQLVMVAVAQLRTHGQSGGGGGKKICFPVPGDPCAHSQPACVCVSSGAYPGAALSTARAAPATSEKGFFLPVPG